MEAKHEGNVLIMFVLLGKGRATCRRRFERPENPHGAVRLDVKLCFFVSLLPQCQVFHFIVFLLFQLY